MKYEDAKFRAWGGELDKQMYYFDVFNVGEFYSPHNWNIDKQPLMRFTGLHDKNGKEIYEGDILEWTARDNDGSRMNSIEAVSWKNGAFVTGLKSNEESLYDDANRRQITKQSRVIGNIYENPELLTNK